MTIQNFSAAQNYNGTSVGSGVARDCYYETEGVAAIWFLFWAAGLAGN